MKEDLEWESVETIDLLDDLREGSAEGIEPVLLVDPDRTLFYNRLKRVFNSGSNEYILVSTDKFGYDTIYYEEEPCMGYGFNFTGESETVFYRCSECDSTNLMYDREEEERYCPLCS